jgi:uncharacterized protein YehS (DUF1456 family)
MFTKHNLSTFSAFCLCLSLFSYAQTGVYSIRKDHEAGLINLNDTSFIRILNGTIIDKSATVEHIEKINYKEITDKEKIEKIGIKTNKPLMLINSKRFDIEYKIDSILYSRKDFINDYKYPSDIQLPILLNGKLLSFDDRLNYLSKLTLNEINEIKYLNEFQSNRMFNNTTPFGVISIKTTSQ